MREDLSTPAVLSALRVTLHVSFAALLVLAAVRADREGARGGGGEHDERGIGAVSGLALGDAIALAAAVAVRLHADAGRLASGEARGKEGHPIAAMDVAEHLPQARQRLRARALPTPRTTKK